VQNDTLSGTINWEKVRFIRTGKKPGDERGKGIKIRRERATTDANQNTRVVQGARVDGGVAFNIRTKKRAERKAKTLGLTRAG